MTDKPMDQESPALSEPTDEAIRAGIKAFQSGHNGFDDLSDWRAFYKTVSAAQSHPAPEPELCRHGQPVGTGCPRCAPVVRALREALGRPAPPIPEAPAFDPGDHVHHAPTGEDWVVRRVIGDKLEWFGWPPGQADVADCTLIKRAPEAPAGDKR